MNPSRNRPENYSRKDAKAAKVEKNEQDGLENYLSFDSELGVLCVFAENTFSFL